MRLPRANARGSGGAARDLLVPAGLPHDSPKADPSAIGPPRDDTAWGTARPERVSSRAPRSACPRANARGRGGAARDLLVPAGRAFAWSQADPSAIGPPRNDTARGMTRPERVPSRAPAPQRLPLSEGKGQRRAAREACSAGAALLANSPGHRSPRTAYRPPLTGFRPSASLRRWRGRPRSTPPGSQHD